MKVARTTVRLDEELLRQAKEHAARSGQTLTAVIENALRESLSRGQPEVQREPVTLITDKGQGLQPGVDLDDSASLLELMEEN